MRTVPEGLSDGDRLLWREGRAQGLREAANQLHTEARWQQELASRDRAEQSWRWHVDRLLMLEKLLGDRARL